MKDSDKKNDFLKEIDKKNAVPTLHCSDKNQEVIVNELFEIQYHRAGGGCFPYPKYDDDQFSITMKNKNQPYQIFWIYDRSVKAVIQYVDITPKELEDLFALRRGKTYHASTSMMISEETLGEIVYRMHQEYLVDWSQRDTWHWAHPTESEFEKNMVDALLKDIRANRASIFKKFQDDFANIDEKYLFTKDTWPMAGEASKITKEDI